MSNESNNMVFKSNIIIIPKDDLAAASSKPNTLTYTQNNSYSASSIIAPKPAAV